MLTKRKCNDAYRAAPMRVAFIQATAILSRRVTAITANRICLCFKLNIDLMR
jgi:hypothetical protein